MKKRCNYIIVIVLFILIMILIILFFINKYEKIDLKNKANYILEQMYVLKKGKYNFNNGIIYNDDNTYVKDKYDISGNGSIEVDKYGNVKFYIDTNKYCISKTSLGNINISKGKCNGFKEIKVEFIRNNNILSFITNINKSEYLISNKDDLNGTWIENNEGTLVLNSYTQGDNYIWFKDSYGNISEPIKFNVDCLDTISNSYDSSVFYCSGSKVTIDNIKWIVLKDTNNKITLIQDKSIKEKLSHCILNKNGECQLTNLDNQYIWDNSYINLYLNFEYINSLSNETKNNIVEEEVCVDNNSICGNEKCIGYTKEEIINNNYTCNNYKKYKIRLITYDEYNNLYKKINKNIIGTNLWILNTFMDNKSSMIDINNDVYINEELSAYHYVKPVITLLK